MPPYLAVVLAVDPGTQKCGVAVVDRSLRVLARRVIPLEQLLDTVSAWIGQYGVSAVVIGDRTGAKRALKHLAPALGGRPVHLVDEHLSSLEGRQRYFQENPPRGWRRLIPRGLRVPPCPIDDYVAVVLAERCLRAANGPLHQS